MILTVGEQPQKAAAAVRAQLEKAQQAQALRNQQLVADAEMARLRRPEAMRIETNTHQAAIKHPVYGTTVVGQRI